MYKTNEPKQHISNSSMSMYLKCGQQYKFKKIEGLVVPLGLPVVRGIVNHDVLNLNFSQKIRSGVDLSPEVLIDAFNDTWSANIERFIVPDSSPVEYKDIPPRDINEDESPQEAVNRFFVQAFGQFNAYALEPWEPHEYEAPHSMAEIKPIMVEQEIRIDLGDNLPDLLCYLDRVDEGDIIVDTKFPGKSPAKDDINNDVQLAIYDLAFRTHFGRIPGGLRKEYAVGLKTPKVVVQQKPANDEETLERLMNRIRQVVMGMREGIYLPCDSSCWWCSPKSCDYWGLCNYRP